MTTALVRAAPVIFPRGLDSSDFASYGLDAPFQMPGRGLIFLAEPVRRKTASTAPEIYPMTYRFTTRNERRGAVAVEAAIVLPILIILMLGIWEVGRIIQVNQIVVNAAREGARLAAGGYTNGTPVTDAMVQQAARDYMTAAGLPTAAVSGAQISTICQASPSWTDPYKALPLDKFQVQVIIPQGTAFDSLRWSLVNQITATKQMTVSVNWESLNDSQVVVTTGLPY